MLHENKRQQTFNCMIMMTMRSDWWIKIPQYGGGMAKKKGGGNGLLQQARRHPNLT